MIFAGSPAQLSLAQAAEAELAAVAQDHAPNQQPVAAEQQQAPLVAVPFPTPAHSRRSDDRCIAVHCTGCVTKAHSAACSSRAAAGTSNGCYLPHP